jgi:hypothetical protein
MRDASGFLWKGIEAGMAAMQRSLDALAASRRTRRATSQNEGLSFASAPIHAYLP